MAPCISRPDEKVGLQVPSSAVAKSPLYPRKNGYDTVTRSVLTLAVGDRLYLRLAVHLARSFSYWHEDSDIRFSLATDQAQHLPPDLEDIEVIDFEPGQFGEGFSPKLYLNEFAPAEQTLFVDADCLCTGPLDEAFDRFAGHDVSVIGRPISEGEWFGDVAEICDSFDIPAMPKFNGGVYYLEPGSKCDSVYQTAQSLKSEYDEIGFERLRTHPNDEVLVSLAMALHEQEPVREDGTVMNSTLACPGGMEIDVLRGISRLYNPIDHPEHNNWYRLEEMNPALVHFLGHETTQHPYRREAIRLKKVVRDEWPMWAADAWAGLRFSMPWLTREQTKDLLRPVYHALFGTRPIEKSADTRH